MKEGKNLRLAKKIAKKNIGYWAGYYDEETTKRIWKLYRTEHPVFGKRWPKPDEAFRLGLKWGKKSEQPWTAGRGPKIAACRYVVKC